MSEAVSLYVAQSWPWGTKKITIKKKQAELLEMVLPMEIFELVASLEEFRDLTDVQSNLYGQ